MTSLTDHLAVVDPNAPERDVRSEIEQIALSAEQEIAGRRATELAILGSRRRLTTILWIGGILIAAQIGLLAYQLSVREKPQAPSVSRSHPLELAQNCSGAKYRTFRAMVRFRKDHGRWPTVLGELVGKYVRELPTDPATGLPLVYATKGEGFTLDCN